MTHSLSRRRALGLGAATAGGVAAASLLPPSVLAALADPPRRGGLRAIEHVVILMQENRSFDHYYGTLRGVRGYGDRSAIELRDGHPVFSQPGPSGRVLPFSVREAAEARKKGPPVRRRPGPLLGRWAQGVGRRMPEQEPGIRPARPRPYQPDAWLSAAGAALSVELRNDGPRSAHFTIWPYAGELPASRHLDVTGRRVESLPLPGDTYHLVVTGPNRFRRDFAGRCCGAYRLRAVAGYGMRRRVIRAPGGASGLVSGPKR